MTTKTIDLVYFNAGGGHRAAALALQDVMARQRRPWNVRLVDLVRVLDPTDGFRRVTGFAPEELYNKRLQRGWTLGLAQELKLLQGLIRLMHKPMQRSLTAHWARTEPDLVVSLVPNFNRVLCESVTQALPGVPFVTVLTDMADHPPHFWIEPGQDQTIVCGTPHALAQARAAGYADRQLELVTGMVLKPSFHDLPPQADRAERLRMLGLDPERPTGVVMFGGQGSAQMLQIAKRLPELQLLLMCGRNARLVETLRALRRKAPHAALGFTDDVAGTMRLGDFLIGKPGPGCLSEAVQLGLPVITWRNAWTMPQERYNTRWVREQGVGLVIGALDALPEAVQDLLGRIDSFRAAAARLDNRAVFEIPEILARKLAGSPDFGAADALIARSSRRAATS
jgi:UDP-N-acetylglucosamine:LPS N-acetylglucosamine transferase